MLASGCRTQPLDGDGTGVIDVDLGLSRDFGSAISDMAVTSSGTPVDILIVFSSEAGTDSLRTRIRDAAGSLFGGLANVQDWHVGIVSADVGVGSARVNGCSQNGDAAKLNPTTSSCNVQLPPYLAGSGSKAVNFSGDPTKVFGGCYVGDMPDGCTYQQPWNAAIAALSPTTNPGFLRAGSRLAVIFVVDVEDCSIQTGSTLFSQNRMSPDGPIRCLLEGSNCNSAVPGTYPGCRIPADDPGSQLRDGISLSNALMQAIGSHPSVVIGRLTPGTTTVTIDQNGNEGAVCQENMQGDVATASVRLDSFPLPPVWTTDATGSVCSPYDDVFAAVVKEVTL